MSQVLKVLLGVSCFVLETVLGVLGVMCLVSRVISSGEQWEGTLLGTLEISLWSREWGMTGSPQRALLSGVGREICSSV